MKFTLKDYQWDAVAEVLNNLRDARDDFHRERPRRSAFSLTAVTGAGKTVMAAAVIEALFVGNDDFNFEPDPGAVVLWFTSDPSLNEQTRHRLQQAADGIPYNRLKVIENTFAEEKLTPGNVYFLNSQKLASRSLLVRGASTAGEMLIAPDMRARTFWEVLRNTIDDPSLTLYLILDEAHRGMKAPTAKERSEKSTIVRQLVNGEAGAPAVPIVLGISATAKRFDEAMAGTEGRTILPNVQVDPVRVQESGLLKDDIRLDFPTERGVFDTVLLRRAVRKVKESSQLWADYHDAQELTDDPVIPLLVVQVPNTPSEDMLLDALAAITEEWSELNSDSIAHVFGDHLSLDVGTYSIPYVSPEDVQERSRIKVLLAKDAVSTGWDCPRAEVLVSFRPAKDETHITQLLGRMVRTPLARRVPGDDRLNAVDCLLPHFNRETATSVANVLMGLAPDSDPDENPGGQRILYGAKDMSANALVPASVWDVFDQLPTETVPRKGAKPIKRLSGLAQALSYDGLMPKAHKAADAELFGVLDGLAARFKDKLADAALDVKTAEGETIVAGLHSKLISVGETFHEVADERAVAADFKAAGRVLGPDLARKYADRLAADHDDDDGFLTAHLQIAALAKIDEVGDELDRVAGELAEKWFKQHRVAIKGLTHERQAVYADLLAMAGEPQEATIARPAVRTEATQSSDGDPVATRAKHLMSDDDGNYPIGELRPGEVRVLDRELDGAVAWYRNPSRASSDALSIAYSDAKGWRRLCPDFVFFTQVAGAVRPSIVDPHGAYLADALPKLRGLARYAEQHADAFHRIEAVDEVDGVLRVLDLTNAKVRDAIEAAQDAIELYRGAVATDY